MGLISRACAVRTMLFCFIVLSVSYVHCAVLKNKNSDLFRLNFIHYNDFHARFEQTSKAYPVCNTSESSCLGGISRLFHEVQSLHQEYPDAIVLNAGDVFQGTYWYTLMKWDVTQKFINLLPNDAHTVGNHEFDDGVAGLAPYLAALKAPVVVANIDTSNEPSLEGLYSPHIIIKRKGKNIGIIGVITNTTAVSSNPDRVKFLDPIATVRKEAEELYEQGIDIIVVLSHCGLEVDKKIAHLAGENIDVIVGGHSHSLLYNSDAPDQRPIAGPYPLIEVAGSDGHKVVIVTAAAYTEFVGNLTVYFDDDGKVQKAEGNAIHLDQSVPEDPKIMSLLQPYVEKMRNLVGEVVGYTDERMDELSCGRSECVLGNFITDALINKTKQTSETNLPHVAMVLKNMIRGSIPHGNITRGSIINTLPYTNQVVTFAVKGEDLLKSFEICLKSAWKRTPFAGPLLPQVSGLRVTLNTTSQKPESVLVNDEGKWKPLEPDMDYQLTTVRFLLKGGNGFEMFKKYTPDARILGVDSEIFENYIISSPTIPKLEKRLVLVE